MKLKLDLHTHPFEASHFERASVSTVGKLLDAIVAKGLDGIGVTEHFSLKYGMEVKRIADEHFPDAGVLLIPGHEIEMEGQEVVELYLANGTIFRFLAHPGHPRQTIFIDERFHGIEYQNGMHNWHINKPAVKKIAEEKDLMILTNSDAHYLDQIGVYYNEIDLDELTQKVEQRAKLNT